MSRKRLDGIVVPFFLFLSVSLSQAQNNHSDVYWHIDPRVKTCSMVIDPSLTQDQWHKFTKQVSAIASFKLLSTAETLGKKKFSLVIDNASTPIDQHDPAWINTFTHPDENCPLGDNISYPTIRAKMGISDNMDVGVYWTKAISANYGAVGAELKYAFLNETNKLPAAALRVSYSMLTGVSDFNLNLYSIDLIASKRFTRLAPYVGFRENLTVGRETTSKVALDRENLVITQGYIGVVYSIWKLNLAAEYNISSVNTFAYAIGFVF